MTNGKRRRSLDERDEEGFGLIEVVLALTVLAITFLAAGLLIVDTFSSAQQARQRTTANSLVQQIDALIQTNAPTMTCAAASTYVTGAGSGFTTRNGPVVVSNNGTTTNSTSYTVVSTPGIAASHLLPVTIKVTWKSAARGTPTVSVTNSMQVQCL